MILQLASHHCRKIAGSFAFLFLLSIVLPARAAHAPVYRWNYRVGGRKNAPVKRLGAPAVVYNKNTMKSEEIKMPANRPTRRNFIGGPSQPEMSSFRSVSADKLVNLFTGDFSYNIPLLDVGGYPVNIYYDGGVSPEQEASWVGLGWNINPGNINRNMRGVPDDFNGNDTLEQTQKMKANKTWGLGIGADAELLGIKVPVNVELGVAFNNYLGPSLSAGIRGSTSLFNVAMFGGSEKFAANLGASLSYGVEVNSRSGTSFSGKVSLGAGSQYNYNRLSVGAGLSTDYNSRTGIKALQLSEQVHLSNHQVHNNLISMAYLSKGIGGKYSTTISFAKPSYFPSIRMPQTNTAWSARLQIGAGSYGLAYDVEAEVYGQKSEVSSADALQKKPMVGYLYYQNAINKPNYVMDFSRFNDREVTPNTPVISVPQYTYDVFSIQGEGTGGNIRAYRNDLGYVRDNITTSKDRNFSIGGDIDVPGHYGANFNTIKTPSTIGEWNNGNRLRNTTGFTQPDTTFEHVYFRNPGEACVTDPARFAQTGGTSLVRYVLGGSVQSPTVEPMLQVFDAAGKPQSTLIDLRKQSALKERNKRTQVISFLTATEAAEVGLDTTIKSYNNTTFLDAITDTLLYTTIKRVGGYRKPHHLSQINVTESNGKRYVYGIPVYNVVQKDFTFSVSNAYSDIPEQISMNTAEAAASSPLLNDNSSRDGYVQITRTPAYAHSFLLSGILSPDYVDVTGNGITEDDLGDAVKFNYTRIREGNDTVYKWHTPQSASNMAHFNAGLRSEVKDDKAMFTHGERESWYLQSVESKTMIALFYVSNRSDAKGSSSELGGVNASNVIKKLDSIALYNKSDLKANGLAKAKSIKTVHFDYKYLLCRKTPDNTSGDTSNNGKLTLQSIYFTYNGKTRAFKNNYSFSYTSTAADNTTDNPKYAVNAADRWGTYKPASLNPGGMKNSDYPYSIQPSGSNTTTVNNNADAWMLKKIILPSGGQIEVSYESDDYAYVQNKRAAVMVPVAGFGSTSTYSAASNRLYPISSSPTENDYVFMQVPEACSSAGDVYQKYLQGLTQLAFKIWVQMPKGPEYVPCYASFGSTPGTDYGVDASNNKIIWVKMKQLGGKSPLSMTTLEYLRQQLPGQAFEGYDVSGEPPLRQVGDMLVGMLKSLRDAFSDPVNAFRKDGKAAIADLSKCFVRLNDADGHKYGGGYRVRSVVLRNNWDSMTRQYAASYGQQYDYTTAENFGGAVRRISSGVASYEPSIGNEENPWQSIIQVEDDLPLGPTSYGAVEMPVLDAFFPSPVVGYSKVTVTSLKTNTDATKKSRSGVGRQVTEFYTAKDFPVYYSYTSFDSASVKEFHQASTSNFFNKYGYDFKAQSQGFLVATNDMHGKMRSQSSYAENDTATRINYTENFYRNTGANGLNDQFTFISRENSGGALSGNMGIDVELMTDTREFSVKGTSREYQGQLDWFYFGIINFPIPTLWKINGVTENTYRAVTTTKFISYHAVLDSVVVIDKGSQVSTKNVAYDAQTGEVLVSRTNNEFNKPVYNTSYPAYWAYSGMGLAYKNIDARYSGINFVDGKIMNNGFDFSVFESGDELYIMDTGTATTCPASSSGAVKLIWALNKNKNTTSLTDVAPAFIFIDEAGKLYNRSGVQFRIIRSGHRNMLEAQVAAITGMVNPLASGKLLFNASGKQLNASAVEFREKWQTDNDVIGRYRLEIDPATCTFREVGDPNGYLEKNINPYRKGLLGNFRTFRDMVFYDSRMEYDTTANTNIAENGFLKNFKLYWDFNTSSNLVPDAASTQWVWNTRSTRFNAKGMELETQNALGIYTAAQYGYHKTLPVAITENSRYNEMAYEGFEDSVYAEALNPMLTIAYAKKFIDFTGITNASVIPDNTVVSAHSGKYMMAVKANSTAVKQFAVQGGVPEDFTYTFGRVTSSKLFEKGMNSQIGYELPAGLFSGNAATMYTYGDSGIHLALSPSVSTVPHATLNAHGYAYSFNLSQYFEITREGVYHFGTAATRGYDGSAILSPNYITGLAINSVTNGERINFNWLGTITPAGANFSWQHYSACLPKGIYQVTFYAEAEVPPSTQNPVPYDPLPYDNFDFEFFNNLVNPVPDGHGLLPGYRSLTTQNTCTYDIGIPATDDMHNAVFNIPAVKKMVFSAWVRESCGNPANGVPCKQYTYQNNQVKLTFPNTTGGDVTLIPSGPIIDGWQRVEGEFTAPVGATSMTLNLVNNGAGQLYVDDIRIHPFNANMKNYVYDPVNLRLVAELDANNYASFYEYDEEGTLVRTKVETREGIKTITETRSALQKVVR